MAVNTKAIQTRISSVKNTKKITKAMEMISAVKMRKATENVLSTRSYSNLSWEMLKDVAEKTDINLHPLLAKRPVKKLGIVLITSNRGLCGGFVSKLLVETDKYIKKLKENYPELETEIMLMGKKGRKIYKYYGHEIVAEFEKQDLTVKIEEILDITRSITAEYVSEKYDKVALAYTDFTSPVNQVPRIKEILPLSREKDEMMGEGKMKDIEGNEVKGRGELVKSSELDLDFKFEPNPKEVLDFLLPKLVEVQIYQAILESDASEHSARMMAMRNATDSAGEMIDELTMEFNKARQAKITQEISEIVGGVAALE